MKSRETFRAEVRAYVIGGVLSLAITIAIYFAVTLHWWQSATMAAIALVAAAMQFAVQSRYFLHLGKHDSAPLMRQSIIFTGIMLLIIVVGSLWVMTNLNYNMGMSSQQMEEFMLKQNKKGF